MYITAHVICPTAELLVDLDSSGIDLKNVCMVQRIYYRRSQNETRCIVYGINVGS